LFTDSVPDKNGWLFGSRVSWNQSEEKGGTRGWEGISRARPAYWEEKDQLESSRDGGNMMKDNKESIQGMMQEDQQPTE
jgi:hypothetical protein